MKITAVTQDQLILIDGVAAQIGEIGGFFMQRGEWAVHFDTELGIGHIEYLDIRSNQSLTLALFEQHYAWLIDKHAEYQQWLEAQVVEEEPTQPDQISEQVVS